VLIHTDRIAWNARTCAGATSEPDDRFTATFAPRQASATGVRLSVAVDGTAVQTLDDVVFGDVFLFSGQSNIDVPEACQSAAFLSTHRACTHTHKSTNVCTGEDVLCLSQSLTHLSPTPTRSLAR
jgi:hypothetical protein